RTPWPACVARTPWPASPPDGAIEQLDGVKDGQRGSPLAEVGADLQRAPGIPRGDRVSTGLQEVLGLSLTERPSCPRMHQVVDAGRAAADLPLGRLDQLEFRDVAQ